MNNNDEHFIENPEQCVPKASPFDLAEIRHRNLGTVTFKESCGKLPDICENLQGETLSLMSFWTVAHIKVLENREYEVIRTMGRPIDDETEYLVIHPKY